MCAGWLDLNVDRGTSFNTSVVLTDVNGNPMNLTNVVINSVIKKSYITSNVAANITCTIANSVSGIIYLTIPYQITQNLWPYRYVYDVVLRNTTSNSVTRVLEGTIYINPGVSTPP